MPTITPTVGRKVWLWGSFGNCYDLKQPYDATVLFVHPDGRVNLHVVDHAGKTYTEDHVELRNPHPGDEHGGHNGVIATWMPFQVGQARPERERQTIGASDVGDVKGVLGS